MLAKCKITSEILSVERFYRRAPLRSMTTQPVVGVYDFYPVNDYNSKVPTKRCILQIILKLSPYSFDDTNYI